MAPPGVSRDQRTAKNYDQFGFPIPPEFTPPEDSFFDPSGIAPAPRDAAAAARGDRKAGRGKKLFLLGVLAAVVLPGLLAPAILPAVSEAVVQWSLERAMVREARGNVRAAIGDMGRAIRWAGDDTVQRSRLLCWRAMLRIEDRDPRGAIVDAEQAISMAPTSVQPHRVRALARVMLNQADAALSDAQAAVDLAGPGDPEALNHRAYIRALVGRDLNEALEDIDAALAENGDGAPEFLDTKGFVLHLLGRHHEAVDQLNLAIDATQQTRRELMTLAGRADPDELAYRLRSLDHGLAVMLHHRGLACQSLGLDRQARQDLETAERKGFAPDRGIF
ncbi:MAG: tetratricopeptide repeat protein [Pirellulales bacterium]